MTDDLVFVPRARAAGDWGGTVVEGEVRVRVHPRGIVLAWSDGRAEWRVPFTEMSGFTLRADALVLFGAAGSLSLTSAQQLPALCDAMLDRACALPELARGARSVGSRRAGDPATQARFFAPVLEARRRAELQPTVEGKVRAMDGSTIAAQVTAILGDAARARWPNDLPEQRALGAEFEECCEGLFIACDALNAAAREWIDAPDELRLSLWREWVMAAARVFSAADRAWGNLAAVLGTPVTRP